MIREKPMLDLNSEKRLAGGDLHPGVCSASLREDAARFASGGADRRGGNCQPG
jgi:hypothetical protein